MCSTLEEKTKYSKMVLRSASRKINHQKKKTIRATQRKASTLKKKRFVVLKSEEVINAKKSSCVAAAPIILPIKKRFGGADLWKMFGGDAYAMQAAGNTVANTPWSFTPVTTLPWKKRFINTESLISGQSVDEERSSCAEQLVTESNWEQRMAKKLQMDAATPLEDEKCDENKENIDLITKKPSQVKASIKNENWSQRTMLFQDSQTNHKSNSGSNECSLSKWTTLKALNNLSETAHNLTYRRQIYRCNICETSFEFHMNLTLHLQSHFALR